MLVTFLGVRGSTPAPGEEFLRYGGHTSCLAVATGAATAPSLLLDAGTGLRTLPTLLHGAPFAGSLLLTHLHWDHVQGIPFCPAVDREDARVEVYLPAQDARSARDLLAQQLSPPTFPIGPEGLRGEWSLEAVDHGSWQAAAIDVTAFDVVHKGGRTLGYRLDHDGASLAYLPDHAPAAGVSDRAMEVLSGVDVLVHDAQFLAAERALADAFGHATVDDAVELARRVDAGTLVLFHHAPGRLDDALDAIAAGAEEVADRRVLVARQGGVLDIPGPVA